MRHKKPIILQTINYVGLFVIGVFCLLYSTLTAAFAELHINFSVLDFPVFVGEILLIFCALLSLLKIAIDPPRWNLAIWGGGLYVIWLLFKAFSGYWAYGPLAFRNAALFYYPFFLVFGYMFYSDALFKPFFLILVACVLMGAIATQSVEIYFYYPYFALLFVLIYHMPWKIVRYAGFLMILALFRLEYFFSGSRSHLMGISGVYFFFSAILILWCHRRKRRFCFWILCALFIVFITGFFWFADPNGRKTLMTPSRVLQEMRHYETIIAEKQKTFEPQPLSINLYNRTNNAKTLYRFNFKKKLLEESESARPEEAAEVIGSTSGKEASLTVRREATKTTSQAESREPVGEKTPQSESRRTVVEQTTRPNRQRPIAPFVRSTIAKNSETKSASPPARGSDPEPKKNKRSQDNARRVVSEAVYVKPTRQVRSLETAYANIIFRLLIWKDMWKDLLREKAVWGINMGKPQRSHSLEILQWASSEWSRDGWITPHNSFFHVVYRAGMVGVMWVLILLATVIGLISDFFKKQSIIGICLVSILLYWIVIANFLVFLEFPYNAIPFWTLLGMILAYRQRLREEARR